MAQKVPVLIIAFNRLDCVKQVFESVREYRPSELYIAADGPREDKVGETEKCNEVRQWLVDHVDWECNVHTRFLDRNVGCGYGPSGAITWFFENVEEGVILEDDCIPTKEFYDFAAVMLEHYRNDNRIMAVDSCNFQSQRWGDGSYYFSMQNGPFCAWATWKRAWSSFEFTLRDFTEKDITRYMKKYGVTKLEKLWWVEVFKNFKAGYYGTSSWDYQFIFAIWKNHGMSIIPNVNMSTNIGFGSDATHTKDPNVSIANRPTQILNRIVHPSEIKICREADLCYHDFYYRKWQEIVPWHKKVKRWIKRIIGYQK